MHRALGLALLLLLSCSSEPAGDDNILIWARSEDSSKLDPAEISWGEDAKISQNIYEPLISFQDDSVELEGRLATRWTFSEDGKTLTMELRKNVKFHDGTDFDAGDVVFTFERLLDRKHPHKPNEVPPYGPFFADIESVKADGPHRAIFQLKKPSAVILYNLTLFGAGIVSPEAVKKHGRNFSKNPVGTGPYQLQRWDYQKKIVLKRFDKYWGPQPPIEQIIVIPVSTPQTALQKLRAGEVHVVDHPTLADIELLQKGKNTKVEFEASLNTCYIGFNMKKFPYNDINFRRAVSLAIDRDQLNRLNYYGLAQPGANIVPPAIWNNTAPTPPYEHNLEKAKELLQKVKLESNEVELIHMTFSRPYVPEPQDLAVSIKDQLRKIGLEVKLRGYAKNAYTEVTESDDHPMFLLGWMADIPDTDNFFYPLLHGDNAPELNSSFFQDSEFNRCVKEAQNTLDPDMRKKLYTLAYQRYREQLPTIPLVHVREMVALARNVNYNKHPIEVRFWKASFTK